MKLESLTNYINEDELLKLPFFQRILQEDQQVQNWRGPFTASQLIDRFLLQDVDQLYEDNEKKRPTFMWTSLSNETLDNLKGAKEHDQVTRRLNDFIRAKSDNPLMQFGKSDKSFSSSSPGGLSAFKHAHLTHDISVVYKYDGKLNQFCIYGVFSHAELGTDATHPNPRKAKAMGIRLHNESC